MLGHLLLLCLELRFQDGNLFFKVHDLEVWVGIVGLVQSSVMT